MIKLWRTSALGVLLFLLLGAGAVSAGLVDFSPGLLRHITASWGGDAVYRLQDWRKIELEGLANRAKGSPALSRDELQFFNRFWNKLPFYNDQQHWKMDDYWATPVESLASNGADCEDYSIAKYFSLRELGVPPGSLRITYVRALKINEAHMVLAYYPTPDADPYILDNLSGKLLPASERDDLEPVYSFNDDDMWAAGAANFKGKSSQIRVWGELLEKMEKERRM
ncbi:MAG: transglutaminase-like cysteine peptidase [Sideroxyarcus sp.]|nr:transglutaminase-like cysteine peptidase [Sideroxyarcus sp.]